MVLNKQEPLSVELNLAQSTMHKVEIKLKKFKKMEIAQMQLSSMNHYDALSKEETDQGSDFEVVHLPNTLTQKCSLLQGFLMEMLCT